MRAVALLLRHMKTAAAPAAANAPLPTSIPTFALVYGFESPVEVLFVLVNVGVDKTNAVDEAVCVELLEIDDVEPAALLDSEDMELDEPAALLDSEDMELDELAALLDSEDMELDELNELDDLDLLDAEDMELTEETDVPEETVLPEVTLDPEETELILDPLEADDTVRVD